MDYPAQRATNPRTQAPRSAADLPAGPPPGAISHPGGAPAPMPPAAAMPPVEAMPLADAIPSAGALPPGGAVPPGAGAASPAEPPPAGMTSSGRVRRTRVSAWWIGLIIAALVLTALLIFVLQNSASVSVHYLGMHGRVPLAVALLLSAIAGILLVAIPGTARIVQLRHALRKNVGAHATPETGRVRRRR